jgi:Ribonuclease G/E
MDYTYRITEWEQAQERAELSEAIHQIYEAAVRGSHRDWDLEAVGGALLRAGLEYSEAQDILADIAAERRDKVMRHYLADAYAAAKRALPEAVDGRLERGLELALAGAVSLQGEGQAVVKSQKEADTSYTVNGKCNCPDAQGRAPMVDGHPACKYQIAVWLIRKAHELMVWEG